MKTGILIDVKNKTITQVEVAKGLQGMYDLIDCTMVEVTNLGGNIDLWTDEEFLLKEAHIETLEDGTKVKHGMNGFFLKGMTRPYMGNGLVLAHDGEGESISCTLPPHKIEDIVTFVEYDNPENRPQPQMGFMIL